MAICKFCNAPMSWGFDEAADKWVPLVPIGDDEGMDRTFVDGDGVLRASHRAVCTNRGGPSVKITKLRQPIKGSDVLPNKSTPTEKEFHHDYTGNQTGV